MKFTHTTKWLSVGAIMLLVSVVVAGLMSVWLQKQGETLKESMQTIANEEALLQDQARLTNILGDTVVDRDELQGYVLKGDDGAVELLSEIDALAVKLGVELTTSGLQVEEVSGDFNDLLLNFNLEGSESRVRQALLVLESLPYASDVISVQLVRTFDPETGTHLMRGTIGLRVSIISHD